MTDRALTNVSRSYERICDHGLTMLSPCPQCFAILSQMGLPEARYVNATIEIQLSESASAKLAEIANKPASKRWPRTDHKGK